MTQQFQAIMNAYRLTQAKDTVAPDMKPIEFAGRLTVLVVKPRVNLTRFHGVFSRGRLPANSRLRELVVPTEPADDPGQGQPGNWTYSMIHRSYPSKQWLLDYFRHNTIDNLPGVRVDVDHLRGLTGCFGRWQKTQLPVSHCWRLTGSRR